MRFKDSAANQIRNTQRAHHDTSHRKLRFAARSVFGLAARLWRFDPIRPYQILYRAIAQEVPFVLAVSGIASLSNQTRFWINLMVRAGYICLHLLTSAPFQRQTPSPITTATMRHIRHRKIAKLK